MGMKENLTKKIVMLRDSERKNVTLRDRRNFEK